MRYRGLVRGLTRVHVAVAVAILVLGGCGEPAPELPKADPLLVDSIAGAAGARIQVVEIGFGVDGEELRPDSLEIQAGDWVDFRTRDGSPRVARFLVIGLDEAQYRFLVDRNLLSSPPLVASGAHWVVGFDDAPGGRYPFEVEGPRGAISGVVWVGPPGV